MKRLMSAALIAALQASKQCQRVDLFALGLPTGQTLYITSGQWDVTIPFGTLGWNSNVNPSIGYQTTLFYAAKYGRWTRGAITSEASFKLNSGTMTLTCVSKAGETYPGLSMGMLNAALNGLFDGAQVDVWTAYFAQGQYGTCLANSIECKFFGTVTKLNKVGRVDMEFECADPFYLMGPSTKVPTRLISSTCPWGFGDSNCNVTGGLAAYTKTFTAAAGSTTWVLVPTVAFTGASAAAGYFQQGVVTCLTGNNAGLSQTVKISAAGALTMMVPWLMPITAGDTFSVVAGCSKDLSTCISKFNNRKHFGGALYTPVPTTAL